jgi:hypothetical protein
MTYSSRLRGRPQKSGRSVSILLVMLAVIAAFAAWNLLQQRDAPIPKTVNLTVLSGTATVIRADAGGDPPLEAGGTSVLQAGDEVQTGSNSRAKLTFTGGETVELGSETHLTVLELHQNPVSRALVAVLALHRGNTLTRIRHVLFQGMRFEIETAVATIQARGTVFQVDALSNDHTYVAVFDGVVRVAMGEQSLDLEAGQASDVYLGQPLVAVSSGQPAPTDDMPVNGTPQSSTTLTDREKTLFPPVETPTLPGDNYVLYTVQQGDTLRSIARKFDMPWEDIWNANKDTVSSPELIRVGQELRIPR